MGLMDARIEALHSQRKIHGVQIIEIAASKGEACCGDCACQK